MAVLPDWMIKENIKIVPFEECSGRKGLISYGVTSYGYDVRVDRHFKVFTNARCTVVDPKNFDPASFVDIEADYCLIPPIALPLQKLSNTLKFQEILSLFVLGKALMPAVVSL